MRVFTPTQSKRLNEVTGFVVLAAGILLLLSLASFHPQDPSWDTAGAAATRTSNLIGPVGAHLADVLLQAFGIGAFLFPALIFALGWKWIRSEALSAPLVKLLGSAAMALSACGTAAMLPAWRVFDHSISPGGVIGILIADLLKRSMNIAGAAVILVTAFIVSTYLVSTFTLQKLEDWFAPLIMVFGRMAANWRAWSTNRREAAREKAEARAREKYEHETEALPPPPDPSVTTRTRRRQPEPVSETLPWEEPVQADEPASATDEIPICQLADTAEVPSDKLVEFPFGKPLPRESKTKHATLYRLPTTDLLNEIPVRSAFDEQELKNTAVAIKSKLEEFNVLGSVVQINPGPVVTTYEYKPEAGIKYSRITGLMEDLCLGLQAESILIERIPGKPTVGIEVPNTKRELISLRAVIESDEFQDSHSYLTISMGKDINGRIKVAALDTMPHALIAGSTGSGKSVMINSLVMSILYKATPDEVRMIMVDPKRVELGIYEGIPHLLTPVITDPRKATNALKNAVLEMERRLRLLAEQGVRNIDQYNRKLRKKETEPRSLFDEDETQVEELKPLPYILILIDESDDAGRPQRGRIGHASGANGARRRYASGAGDTEAQRGRHHRPDQSQLPGAHQLPGGDPRRLADDSRQHGRGAPAG